MTASVDGVLKPTVAGLIVLGRDVDIKRHLPFNEIAFQVLEGSELRINQFLRKPLLKAFEEIETLLNAKIVEQEIDFGLFRAPVPNYSPRPAGLQATEKYERTGDSPKTWHTSSHFLYNSRIERS